MQQFFSILLITSVFFIAALLFFGHWLEALPVALIGACIGWALNEFKRETHQDR